MHQRLPLLLVAAALAGIFLSALSMAPLGATRPACSSHCAMPCAHCQPVLKNGWPLQSYAASKAAKARAVDLWVDVRCIMDREVASRVFLSDDEWSEIAVWQELKQLEDKTGLCLCRICAPEPYRMPRSSR